MRRASAILAALALVAAAGCGGDGPAGAPSACLSGQRDYLEALERAPGEVRLDGSTPISECLVPEQGGGELATVGASLVGAATALNAGALGEGSGAAAVRLGYLAGAVERGAADTGGIHADLVRRINAAARFTPGGGIPPASFERAFGRGYAAGRESG